MLFNYFKLITFLDSTYSHNIIKLPLNLDIKYEKIRTEVNYNDLQIYRPSISFTSPELFLFAKQCVNCGNYNKCIDDYSLPICDCNKQVRVGYFISNCKIIDFILDDIKLSNINIFLYIKTIGSDIDKILTIDGVFGILPYIKQEDIGLVNQLYNYNITNSKIVLLEFTNSTNGSMTIGSNDISKINDIFYEDTLKALHALDISSITISSTKYNTLTTNYAIMTLESLYIKVSKLDFEIMQKNLFNSKVFDLDDKYSICNQAFFGSETDDGTIYNTYCNLDLIKNSNEILIYLPLILEFDKFKITFESLDQLFICPSNFDARKCDFIFRGKSANNLFISLGISFIKNINLLLDQDNQRIGFYGNNVKDIKEPLETYVIVLISCSSVLILSLLIVVIYMVIKRKKRREFMERLM